MLANDPFWPGYSGARRITAVSVGSAGGTVEVADDGKSIFYTPPEDPYIEETFLYVVDELYPAQVTIRIPETLKFDRYEFVKHEPPATLNVLANDPFWPGYAGASASRTSLKAALAQQSKFQAMADRLFTRSRPISANSIITVRRRIPSNMSSTEPTKGT